MSQPGTLLSFRLQGLAPSRDPQPSPVRSSLAVSAYPTSWPDTPSASEVSAPWKAVFSCSRFLVQENVYPPGVLPSEAYDLSAVDPGFPGSSSSALFYRL